MKGEELEGIAARSDFDLSQHQRFSGKPMTVFDEELKPAWLKLDPAKQAELKERYYQNRFKYLTKTAGLTARSRSRSWRAKMPRRSPRVITCRTSSSRARAWTGWRWR